jgi:hypothetical protein
MRATHVLDRAPSAGVSLRRRPRKVIALCALLRAPSLDRQLAAGVPTWRSPQHAARALQLTSARRRRAAARSLEELVERSEARMPRGRSAAIPPCREQVRDALGEIMAISARLRSAEPVDARGVAVLRALLADGGGPCFIRSRTDALTDALREVSRWLSVAN